MFLPAQALEPMRARYPTIWIERAPARLFRLGQPINWSDFGGRIIAD